MQGATLIKIAQKQASCQKACPAGIDVPRYVREIAAGRLDDSLAVIRESIPFPSICGYACFAPCEARCGKGQFDDPVAIRALKRAAAENGGDSWKENLKRVPDSGKKVAVIGAGPAGLSAAYNLALKGHKVTVLESRSEPGGMMRWAIPQYRLPRDVIKAEIDEIEALGVVIKTDTRVESVPKLMKAGYSAVYIACGAQKNAPMGIPGDDLEGVMGAIEVLGELSSGKSVSIGKRVAVIGGGNAAIDAARTAIRLGAEEVKMYYRRTRGEMPAYPDEIDAAIDEGVEIEFLAAPSAIEKQGDALKVYFDCMELAQPDESGRPKPVCKIGYGHSAVFDNVISAIGQAVDLGSDFKVATSDNGFIKVNSALATDSDGVYAGGDVVNRPDSIISAIAHGNRAASEIDKYLGGDGDITQTLAPEEAVLDINFYTQEAGPRTKIPCTPTGMRVNNFDVVEKTLNGYLARKEADRCLWCDIRQFDVELDPEACKECGYCLDACQMEVFAQGKDYNAKGYRSFVVKSPENCVGCMKCFYSCPDFCIEIKGGK